MFLAWLPCARAPPALVRLVPVACDGEGNIVGPLSLSALCVGARQDGSICCWNKNTHVPKKMAFVKMCGEERTANIFAFFSTILALLFIMNDLFFFSDLFLTKTLVGTSVDSLSPNQIYA